MITLITGVPGGGKTAMCVEMILEELKKERKIYVVGIPQLLALHTVPDETQPDGFRYFACENGGNPCTWQKGTWLGIDTYNPVELTDDEFADEESDNACSSWHANGNDCIDKGALVIIDECQTYFRPRSSSAKVPDYIAAFEVHRHQGLDFWLLTQKPNLIDMNLRGLVSRHIHIHTSGMGKKRLEWAEAHDPNSKAARMTANMTKYSPNKKVFDLYKSASEHTKLKIRMPNGVYMLFALAIIFVAAITYLYFKLQDQVMPHTIPSAVSTEIQHEGFTFDTPKPLQIKMPTNIMTKHESAFFNVVGLYSISDRCTLMLEAYFNDEIYKFTIPNLDYSQPLKICYFQEKRISMGQNIELKFDNILKYPRLRPKIAGSIRATRERDTQF